MSDEKISFKIVLIGDTSSNKIEYFKKLTKNNFTKKSISTIGIDTRTLNIKINTEDKGEIEVEIHLQDTAGEERYRTIMVTYFRGAKGIILMYDITNYKSFTYLESWAECIISTLGNSNDYLMILLGNKLGFVESFKKSREVTEEEALIFCKKYDIYWGGECDAYSDSVDKTKERFKYFVEEIYKKVGNKININKSKELCLCEKTKKKNNCI